MYIICVGGEEVRTVLARNMCEFVIFVCESVFVCVCSVFEEGFVALDCVQRLMCMCVCMCIYFVYNSIYTCIYIYMYTRIYLHVCACICI